MTKKHKLLTTIFAIAGFFLILTMSCEKEDPVELPTLSTLSVSEITGTTAKSGGNITDDGGGEINSRGLVWGTSSNPSIEDHSGMTSEGGGAGKFTSTISELLPSTAYYVRAWATNNEGTAYGEEKNFKTDTKYSTVTDIEDNVYETVIIGNQEWMAENLRVTKYNNNDPIPQVWGWTDFAYDYYAIYPYNSISGLNSEEEVLELYGALYSWYTIEDERGLCPTGWSVPTTDEWYKMRRHLIHNYNYSSGHLGDILKSCRQIDSPLGGDCDTNEHPRWNSDNTHYSADIFGFSALPAGRRLSAGHFSHVGRSGYWWSSSYPYNLSGEAFYRSMMYDYGGILAASLTKSMGFSVRCIKKNNN